MVGGWAAAGPQGWRLAGFALAIAACRDPAASARAHMEESLLRLAVAESSYYARHGTYTAVTESLRVNGRPYDPEPDVRLVIARADSGGWRAIAYNARTEEVCRLWRSAPGRPEPGGRDRGPPACR